MKNIKTKLNLSIVAVFMTAFSFSFAVAVPAYAEDCGQGDQKVTLGVSVGCKADENPIYGYAKGVMSFLSILVGVVVVGAIVVGGIGYASARDDKGQIQKSQDIIRNAIIGLLLYIGMAAILNALVPGGIIT